MSMLKRLFAGTVKLRLRDVPSSKNNVARTVAAAADTLATSTYVAVLREPAGLIALQVLAAEAVRWGLAEGEQNSVTGTVTYILVANTWSFPTTARVTLLFEDGSTVERSFNVGGSSRFNVDVGAAFPSAMNRRFGAVIESTNGGQLVVERSMYSNASGVVWATGTNALGTPLAAAPSGPAWLIGSQR